MKILLIEDDDSKRRAIIAHLKSRGITDDDILRAKNMTDFAGFLHIDIGLFIIDFQLPNIDKGFACPNGRAILETIVKAGKNDALLLAISSYPADFPELRELYESHGCILANYANKKSWQSTLDHLLIQLKKNLKLDFVIFCALQEERNPYVALINGTAKNRGGTDCYDIEIARKKGTVILLPQTGLVNAAVVAGSCIDKLKPSVVGMSGVCGGFPERAKKGQLLISSMAYEYQSGKWAADGFLHEPYQVPTDNLLLTDLKILANQPDILSELEHGFSGTYPVERHNPVVGVFTSGSAVIADEDHLKQIERIHRKVNALDMEVFAIHRAAELCAHKPCCICAKTVVDLCDAVKSDELHAYGSYISAKFMVKAIRDYFSE
ncbi:hypothetical protein RS3R6_22330 [Pseudomonas atacamensis]|uniref:Nucleoside phosphorylase domain-containing protein n=1 Tax=Pseudomonas atacamensis TaxID=2565368 RepID=A0ABQ5PGM8_9PSED|nr:hypothetical protein [Pseudomonas atacamensis]GLH42650.1 hypothetical protein RS3R1_17370 [Pseudomonas atacamensis]GLH54051.1 hypothetical protein RS3R6_22330 [Pseudomonas atacamensis]